MIYIIADDLTGANDTGAQFAKEGYRTIVLILEDESIDLTVTGNYDVLVFDTETRNVDEETTRHKLNKIFENINIFQKDIVYKKIDSTLRGNIGAEVEEIMKIFNKKICILSPSFPSHQRVTINGNLLIKNEPVELNKIKRNLLSKQKGSFVPSILAKQTGLPIKRIDISDVNKGPKSILNKLDVLSKEEKQIIILDSNNEKNLQDIVSAGLEYDGSVLFSGSAGLASYLSRNHEKKHLKEEIKGEKEPILIAGGSRNPIMIKQINFLKDNIDFNELKIDIRTIFKPKDKFLNNYEDEFIRILDSNKNLIIYLDVINDDRRTINEELISKYKISFRELENRIKEAFSILTVYLIKKNYTKSLVLTGGDIAVGVCKELNISQLEIINELLPGIPLTRAIYQGQYLNIVTKAGGFGKEDTLYELINRFQKYYER